MPASEAGSGGGGAAPFVAAARSLRRRGRGGSLRLSADQRLGIERAEYARLVAVGKGMGGLFGLAAVPALDADIADLRDRLRRFLVLGGIVGLTADAEQAALQAWIGLELAGEHLALDPAVHA